MKNSDTTVLVLEFKKKLTMGAALVLPFVALGGLFGGMAVGNGVQSAGHDVRIGMNELGEHHKVALAKAANILGSEFNYGIDKALLTARFESRQWGKIVQELHSTAAHESDCWQQMFNDVSFAAFGVLGFESGEWRRLGYSALNLVGFESTAWRNLAVQESQSWRHATFKELQQLRNLVSRREKR